MMLFMIVIKAHVDSVYLKDYDRIKKMNEKKKKMKEWLPEFVIKEIESVVDDKIVNMTKLLNKKVKCFLIPRTYRGGDDDTLNYEFEDVCKICINLKKHNHRLEEIWVGDTLDWSVKMMDEVVDKI